MEAAPTPCEKEPSSNVVKAIILVGGPSKGTRFRPLSMESFPKPLFPIGGKPMIEHHIEACCRIPSLKEILFLGFEEEEAIAPFLAQMKTKYNLPMSYLKESSELGTAGGLYHFKEEILKDSPLAFFVLHCDICCSFPLGAMLDFHLNKCNEKGAVGTLLGSNVERDYANYYGCIVTDDQQCLTHYAEKPTTFVSAQINSGIYCFSPKIFDHLKIAVKKVNQQTGDRTDYLRTSWMEMLHSNNQVRLEQDVFIPLSQSGLLYVFPNTSFWRQIKNAGATVYCNDLYLSMYAKTHQAILAKGTGIIGNVIIHETAKVDPTAVIGPNVTIGANVVIGKGVRILHSIVLDGAIIKDRACITHSVIGWNCTIGQWARIEGVPNHTPNLYIDKVRKGICIVGRDSKVAPEIIIRNCIVMPHKTLTSSFLDEILL